MQQWENLWPDTLGKIDVVPPVQILTKQAEYFNAMMQNVLVAEVTSNNFFDEKFKGNIAHHFSIKAPALGNYNATILTMNHDALTLYPVNIVDQVSKRQYMALDSEKKVLEALKSILRSQEMDQVVSSLLAQSQATMR
jgi:hypothetical protein